MYRRSRKYLLFIIYYLSFVICVVSCTPSNIFRLTGDLDNLRQTDFYIYATDGSLAELDTIHVIEGHFEWQTELNEEATFYLVYPNLNEQIIFARPGDHVTFRGDAGQLRAVNIEGNPENEELTRFRIEHLQVTPDSLQRAIQTYIHANPDSRVSSHLQRQLTLGRNTSSSRLRKGQKLPTIQLPPDSIGGDTLHLLTTDTAARPVLLIFWATWKGDSRNAFPDIREAIRRAEKQPKAERLQPISISLDYNAQQYSYSIKSDTITFDRRHYPQIWDAPICEQFAIRTLPYYILVDRRRRILALGSDWKKDIQPELNKLLPDKK